MMLFAFNSHHFEKREIKTHRSVRLLTFANFFPLSLQAEFSVFAQHAVLKSLLNWLCNLDWLVFAIARQCTSYL